MASVTIGLPVYNGAAYLDKALASLCAQTFKDLTILVSDNASTDETSDIIKKWAAQDKRVEYHRQSVNIGAMANYGWVLKHAESRWFCYAAYDDLWSPNFIELLYEAVTKNPRFLLAAPRLITMFEDGKQDKILPFAEKVKNGDTPLSRIGASLKFAHSGWYYGLFDRMALISYFEKTQVFNFNHVWGHDFIVILSPILADAITGCDEAVYYKRQTPLSDGRYKPKTGKDQLILYCDTLRESFKALKVAQLSCREKAFLLPQLFRFARKVQKPKRILKAFLKEKLAGIGLGKAGG